MELLDVRKWSRRTEFVVVLIAAFGWFSLASVLSLVALPEGDVEESNAGFGWLLSYEAAVLAALGWILHRRGWTLARVGLVPSWSSTALGLAVAAASYVAILVVYFSFAAAFGLPTVEEAYAPEIVGPELDLLTILAVSTLNPVFEEIFVCGYLITVVKETRGLWPAINASAALRLLYHLYQGPAAIVQILPLGLVFVYWYARTGRLWPLVIAHALFDALALLALR